MGRVTHRALFAGPAGAVVALAVLLGAPAAWAAPDAGGSLALTPRHGPPTGAVTAVFHVGAGDKCPVQEAVFFWDGIEIGSAPIVKCVAQFGGWTPLNGDSAPGVHTVSAETLGGFASASAPYRIDPVNSPPPTSGPPTKSPTPIRTTASPTPARTTNSPTPTTSDQALVPPDLTSAVPAPIAAPPTSANAVGRTSAASWTSLTLIAGGGLVLLGLMAIGLLVFNSRRQTDDVVDPNADTQTDLRPVGLDGLLPGPEPGPLPQ